MKMPLGACRRGKLLFLQCAFSRERDKERERQRESERETFDNFTQTTGAGEILKQRQQNSESNILPGLPTLSS